MFDDFSPIQRERLTDTLAARILDLIRTGAFHAGDRLPSIARMAAVFRVGAPTVRQALTKLEMLGVVDVRHGLGVYVRDGSRVIQRMLIEREVVTGD
jgi:GntR family transcriptional regulator, transcriptional repressor for pyruvate dehydrogenase complex